MTDIDTGFRHAPELYQFWSHSTLKILYALVPETIEKSELPQQVNIQCIKVNSEVGSLHRLFSEPSPSSAWSGIEICRNCWKILSFTCLVEVHGGSVFDDPFPVPVPDSRTQSNKCKATHWD